ENSTAEKFSSTSAPEDITAANFSSEGVTEHISAVNFSLEGATEKLSSEGAIENIPTKGAAEKSPSDAHTKVANDKLDGRIATSVVEHELNPQGPCEVADTPLSEIEASLDKALVARVTATLTENGAKATTAVAPLLSTVAGIPASLLQKELTPNIVPNFRSNNEEAAVMCKLKRLKIALKAWHKATYWGNKDKLKQANLSLQKLQKQQEHESLDLQLHLWELEMEKLIDQLMQTEATMWKQRSCIKEEIEGDKNSAYFQAKAKIRQAKAFIEELRTAKGNILKDQKSIKDFLVHSYEEKFKARPGIVDNSSTEFDGCNMEDEKCAEV
ncbi:hypothetical protein IFM89_027774, partial [Coptis chinensis]